MVDCLEGVFPATRLPVMGFLGNPAGIKKLGLLDPGLHDEELTISYEGL